MTTLIVQIEGSANAQKIAEVLHLIDSVLDIKIQEGDSFQSIPIPGLPYTAEERIASVREAEEDYLAGDFVTSDKLRAKHPRI